MQNRIERVNSEVQKELNEILINELRDPRIKGLITIVKVDVSKDLSHCKVFITILCDNENDKKQTFKILQSSASYIRKSLAERINMRITPEIHFFLDETWEEGIKMDRLLDSLNIPKEE